MKKTLKITSIVILILIAVIILVPVIFKKQIKVAVVKVINEKVNAAVKFDDFSVSMIKGFPNLYVSLENLTIIGKEAFAADTLVTFKAFSAKVDLISVIKMENINVKSIILDRPTIYGHKLPDGKVNWDIMIDTSKAPVQEVKKEGEPTKFKATLKKFQIIDANIRYDDDSSKLYSTIKNLNFLLKGDMTQDFTSLDLKSTIEALTVKNGGIKYLNNTAFRFDAVIDADLKNSVYNLKENEIALNDLVMAITGVVKMPGDSIAMDLKILTKKSDFKSVLSLIPAVYMKDFPNVQTKGEFKLDVWVKGIYAAKSMPSTEVNFQVSNAMFKYPSLPKAAEKIAIDLKVYYDGNKSDNTTIDLNKFHVEMAGNPIDASFHVKTPMSDPQMSGKIDGKFDLVSMKDVIPLDSMTLKGIIAANIVMAGKLSSITNQKYEEFKANGNIQLTNFEFTSKDFPQGVIISNSLLKFSPQYVELAAFDSKIGKSDLHLKGKIENFIQYALKNETIRGQFDFTSNLLDLNEFMTGEEPQQTTAVKDTTPLSIIAVPGNIDFKLSSKLTQVNYDKLIIKNIDGLIIVKDSKATLQNLKMNLLEGSMTMNGDYDTKKPKVPKVDFNLAMVDVDIPSTFNASSTVEKLAPVAKDCKGKVSMDLKLLTDLDEHMSPLYPTMQGNGSLKSKSVTLSNSKTFNKIADLLKNDKLRTLSLTDLNIKFEIKDGRIFVQPFDTKFGTNTLTAAGDQGIDQTLNYKMTFGMPRSEFGSGANNVINDLTKNAVAKGVNLKPGDKLNIHALVSGTVTSPDVKLSLTDSKNMKEEVKEQVKAVVEEKKQEIKKEVSAQADKLIKEAESEAQKVRDAAKLAADQVRKESNDKANLIEKQANGQPKFLKDAAKKSADKVRKEGDTKAQGIITEADTKANSIIQKAKDQAAKLK